MTTKHILQLTLTHGVGNPVFWEQVNSLLPDGRNCNRALLAAQLMLVLGYYGLECKVEYVDAVEEQEN